jgi:hypothetical protein
VRTGRYAKGRRSGRDNVERQVPALQKIPLPLETSGPVSQAMDFIEKQDGPSASRPVLRFGPAAFPEAGKRSVGLVPGGVDSSLAKPFRDLEQQGCLADLPRTREKLDTARRWFLESFKESLAALCIVAR